VSFVRAEAHREGDIFVVDESDLVVVAREGVGQRAVGRVDAEFFFEDFSQILQRRDRFRALREAHHAAVLHLEDRALHLRCRLDQWIPADTMPWRLDRVS